MYSTRIRKIWAVILWLGSTAAWAAQAQTAQQSASASPLASQEGDFVTRMFRFGSGEALPQMTLHYATLGAPKRDATGRVTNAVLILHGTGGSGRNFLSRQFSGVLFGPGQLLDASRFFIILPDSIGHGRSSKPSDGPHARFPKYDYADMVHAQHLLLTEGLRAIPQEMQLINTWTTG